MVSIRHGQLCIALAVTLLLPISVASKQGGLRSQRQLAQNRQQPPGWVNDVYHCSNPQQVDNIESDIYCDPSTFQWDLTLLQASAHPGICNGVNYTQIYEMSFIPGALSDFDKPCYWWNLMYGSMAPSATPSTSPPSTSPTFIPSTSPSVSPTLVPTTLMPSAIPTVTPSDMPTRVPSLAPSSVPTSLPSTIPSTLSPSVLPSLLPSVKRTAAPVAATTAPHLPTLAPVKPTSKPVSARPTSSKATYSPTLTSYPTQQITTFSPTFLSTVDHTGVLVRPLANFVIAYSVGSSSGSSRSIRRRQSRQRHLLSVNRYQLTALTATYLIEQLKTDFPNSHLKTVALVLTSVSAHVSVDHNYTTNTSTSRSTFEEALSGEVIFGTTQTSLVPILNDLYDSIQNAFTDAKSLKNYFRILQGSRDPVLKHISRVTLIQGVSAINTTTTEPSPNTTSSSAATQTNQGGVKWSATLIAIVAGAGVATLGVVFLVYLCITHKSRKRRRRIRQQQREQKRKESQKAKEAKALERQNHTTARVPPPPALDTSSHTKTIVPSNKSRRWFSWGERDRSVPDLALQPTGSVNSSPLSMMTTPRTQADSPIKVSAAQSKRRTVKDFDELVSENNNEDDAYFRSTADEDQSEVTSTYSYIETNTNDEHSISVAPSFLYGPNETGSVMGDYDDFGELVGAATKRIHRTPWIDDLNLAPKTNTWGSATTNAKKVPVPPSRNASAPPILNVGKMDNPVSPTTQSSQDPDNSHLLNISASYGSFFEYDEKKGIMIIARPSMVEDPIPIDGEMPSKIGRSFALEDSFFTQEGSQTDALIVVGDKGEVSVLDSPGRMPGMDSGGSLFLNSPATSFSTSSPRKGMSAWNQQQSTSVDDQGIGEVLQFYEGTTNATSTSSALSPVKAKKFAFGDVWRDIVEEDVDDHVRDTTSSTNNEGRSSESQGKVATKTADANPSVSHKSNRSTSSHSQRVRSDASATKSLNGSTNADAAEDAPYYLDSPDRLNRSGASSRKSMTPNSSKSAVASNSPNFDEEAETPKQGTRVSFSSEHIGADESPRGASPATKQADARSHEMTTRLWLASQANEQRSDAKQSRSKSVAPPAGHRQRGNVAASSVPNSKRSSSLPPSRHAALHKVREEQPFDEDWSPR